MTDCASILVSGQSRYLERAFSEKMPTPAALTNAVLYKLYKSQTQ